VPYCRVVVFLGILIGLAAGEPERVPGVGYASSSPPVHTNDPPADMTEEEDELDPLTGTELAGTDVYDLQQGPHADDKKAWADTDYVKWTAAGATLVAEGKAHDSDPDQATIVSSEAWGSQAVDVIVTKLEGDWGKITAKNTIYFRYNYLISGASIGEASVQLSGTAFDIKGKAHRFNLSDQRAEGVTVVQEKQEGFTHATHDETNASVSQNLLGPAGNIVGKDGSDDEETGSTRYSVARSLAKAGGDTNSTPQIVIEDLVEGDTDVSAEYSVFSNGRVILRARAGTTAGTASPVLIDLKEFRVNNALLVFKESGWGDPGPPDTPVPDGCTTESEHDSEELDEYGDGDMDPPFDPCPPEHDGCGSGQGALLRIFDGEVEPVPGGGCIRWPDGLAQERGSSPGRASVWLGVDAPRDIVFNVEVTPYGILDLAGRSRLVVKAGGRWGSIPVHGAAPGEAIMNLHLLDAQGAPTGDVLSLDFTVTSTHEHISPRLWAAVPGKAWAPGRSLRIKALKGEDAGPLWIGRTGFSALDTEVTAVDVTVDDPDGILAAALPATVVIAAGDLSTAVPLELGDAEGTATVHLSSGDESVDIVIISRTQAWESLPVVRVPLGAVAPIPILLRHVESAPRDVDAFVADASVGAIDEADTRVTLQPGQDAWFFRFRALNPGSTVVTLTSPGLDPLQVTVEVVPARVTFQNGALRITGLPPTAAGTIHVWAPAGVTLAVSALPPESAEYLQVVQMAPGYLRVEISPSPDLPEHLTVPMALGGDVPSPLELGILDDVNKGEEEDAWNSFHVRVQ